MGKKIRYKDLSTGTTDILKDVMQYDRNTGKPYLSNNVTVPVGDNVTVSRDDTIPMSADGFKFKDRRGRTGFNAKHGYGQIGGSYTDDGYGELNASTDVNGVDVSGKINNKDEWEAKVKSKFLDDSVDIGAIIDQDGYSIGGGVKTDDVEFSSNVGRNSWDARAKYKLNPNLDISAAVESGKKKEAAINYIKDNLSAHIKYNAGDKRVDAGIKYRF